MKKRMLAVLMSTSLVAAALVGCGSAPAAAPAAPKAEEKKEEAPAAEEKAEEAPAEEVASDFPTGDIEFTWMHHLQEEGKQAWVQYCIDQFTAEHPNVTINVEILSADQFSTMLRTKAASGDAPMIFDADTTNFAEYVSAGYCADVSDIKGYENFDPGTLAQGQIDGVQYGVPLDVNAYCIFYNKDAFAQAGITEVPTTIDGLKEVCEQLQAAGIQPFTTGFSEQWCLRRFADYVDIIAIRGNDNWYVDKMNGTSNFADDEAFKKAMTIMCSYADYWGNDPFGETWSDVQNKLATGQAAMTINGSWIISGCTSINPDCQLGAFPMPIVEEGDANLMLVKPGNNFCVFNNQEDPDTLTAAKAFFEFMCSQDSAAFYAVSAQGLTGCINDADAGPCINEVNQYQGDKLYVQSGITTFNSEYNGAFQDVLQQYCNANPVDIDAMCVALDEAMASIK